MTNIGPVVDPPVDGTLTVEWWIIAIDIFGDGSGNVACVPDARLGCRAIGARMDIELMAGDVIGVSLRGLGKQWIDRIRRQSFRCTIGVDSINDLR